MNLNKMISLALILSILPTYAKVSAEELLGLTPANRTASMIEGSVENTPEEYIFEYGGQEFILLDKEQKNEKTYFFVMTEDVYGVHKYDNSTRSNTECLAYWEPEDEFNMAAWLNTEFLENGNGGKALPEAIKAYIDNEHVWHTEPLKNLEGYQSEKLTESPLALLSNYEWKKYIGKIGQNASERWYFRTARTGDVTDSTNILCTGSAQPLGTTGAWRANGTELSIRPVFYLDSDFFADEKLDNIGRNVMTEIDSFCNPELYSQEEKDRFFPAPTASQAEISGEAVVGEKLELNYVYDGLFPEGKSEFKWYQSDAIDGEYTLIEGENNRELLLKESLQGKYIKGAVIPKSISNVNGEGAEVMAEIPVGFIFGEVQIKEAVESVLNASAETVLSELEKANVIFKLDLDLYALNPESRENAMVIFSKMEFSDIEGLRSAYKSAVALACLNELEDITLTETMLKAPDLGIDLTRFDNIKDKDYIINAVFNKNFEDFAEFERTFNQASAVSEVNQSGRDTIKEVLIAYSSLFSTDISKLTDHQLGTAGTAVLKQNYTDFSALDAAVTKAYKDALEGGKIELPKPPSSGGSSGRGGGGGGGSITPAVTYHNTEIPSLTGEKKQEDIKKEVTEKIEFNDINDALWAKDSIYALAERKILSGDGDGSFRPNAQLTREEFVRMVVSAFCPDEESEGVTAFNDVNQNAWYAPYIETACKNKLVMGISDSEFGIGTKLTREDMVVILYRALESKKAVSLAVFDDSEQISPYALEAVLYMAGAGIVSGMEENKFMPKKNATRAMAAQVLYKTLQFSEK